MSPALVHAGELYLDPIWLNEPNDLAQEQAWCAPTTDVLLVKDPAQTQCQAEVLKWE